jgi:carbon storage regulator CsrA
MLVLNRRMGEAFIIDGTIRVVLLHSDRRSARLGIVAPAATGVLREELTLAGAQGRHQTGRSADALGRAGTGQP